MMLFKCSIGLTRSLFVGRFVGNIYRNLTELCTTPACSVLSVQRWVLNALSYNVCRNERKFEHCKVLLELFWLVTMNCGGIIIPNSPSCEARLRQMTMTCGRITNYTSCVARQPLWHMIMACDHNTRQTSYGTRTFAVSLRGYEQNGADEASKFTRSIPHSSKSGNGSIRLRYVTKTLAQCPVHCCRSEWAWSERARQLSNQQKITL